MNIDELTYLKTLAFNAASFSSFHVEIEAEF